MKTRYLAAAIPIAFAGAGTAFAAPTGGAYLSDPQHEWVQDKLAENIGMPNMIMCFVSALRADAMVNQGPYVALVDMEKCDSGKRGQDTSSSTNVGATTATNYTSVVVNSVRVSNDDPMIAHAWFVPNDGGGTPERIFARAVVSVSPSTTNPNGQFSVSFCGVAASQADPLSGSCSMFLGTMSANASVLTFSENGMGDFGGAPQPYTTRLTITKSSTGGSGRIAATGQGPMPVDAGFVYDSQHFKRGQANPGKCFSRDRAQADYSTWRYGVYMADGSRLDLAQPGFPIRATYGGQTYWGGASFWGVFLPGGVLDQVTQVTRVEPGSNAAGTVYDLTKAGGKLYRMTKVDGLMGDLKGQSVMVFLPGNVVAGDANGGLYELTWDGAQLVAVRRQNACDQNGCTWTDLAKDANGNALAPTYVTASGLRASAPFMKALQGYSQSAGGEVRIEVPASGELADATPVTTRSRAVVVPGSAMPNLVCTGRCPKGALSAGDFTGNTVFQDITYLDWSGNPTTRSSEFVFEPVQVASAISYAFASDGLLMSGGNAVDASALALNGNYQYGLQSGRLIDANSASFAAARCGRADINSPYEQSSTGDTICPWLVDNVPEYYTYETGPNPWNRYVGLSSGGVAVSFDPPMNFVLTVSTMNTTEAAGSPLIGSKVQLNYNGFGDLQGIPGTCVDTTTNQPVTCGTGSSNGQRWVPAFSIKDGTELVNDSVTYYAKYLEREMRFGKVPDAACATLDLTAPLATALPGAPTDDPRAAMGTQPTVTAAPKVVHGVVQ
ncbi:MAG: hypothetical protein HZA64_10950 [Rhodocyclales bacterium]|nr:hypothetical protein [Rhodocyclales bacterium]